MTLKYTLPAHYRRSDLGSQLARGPIPPPVLSPAGKTERKLNNPTKKAGGGLKSVPPTLEHGLPTLWGLTEA